MSRLLIEASKNTITLSSAKQQLFKDTIMKFILGIRKHNL